jgi:hypothetical protein
MKFMPASELVIAFYCRPLILKQRGARKAFSGSGDNKLAWE